MILSIFMQYILVILHYFIRQRIIESMNQLRQNLIYLMSRQEINPSSLAKVTGLKQPTIHRVLKGDSEDPRTSTLQPIADYFGITVEFLRTVDMEAFHRSPESYNQAEISRNLLRFRSIPIASTVKSNQEGYLEAIDQTQGDDSIEYQAKDQQTYALRVRGESMRPRVKSGEFIVLEPSIEAVPGDDVLIICRDGRKILGELLYCREDEVTLGSINNVFKPVSLQIQNIRDIHYVAAIVPRSIFHKPRAN